MNPALHRLADRVRRGESIPAPVAALLAAATPLTRAGMWVRLRLPRVRVNAYVVSLGNITAGGTGKTPAVIDRAQRELARGKKVAVLTRAYGSRPTPEPLVVTSEQETGALWQAIGDEAALVLRKAPGVTVVKAADRVAGAQAAVFDHGCDTLILDDGFQYVRLERDENIVCIDATNPFGNGRLLPRGILREPIEALRRATRILLTRCDQTDDLNALEAVLKDVCPHIPVTRTTHVPKSLWRIRDGVEVPLETLRGREAVAVCAVGNPESFFNTLRSLGAQLTSALAFRDHRQIPWEQVPHSAVVVTTEKDAIRSGCPRDNVLALGIALEEIDLPLASASD